MSLNHITSSSTYNPWMNISCNDLKCKTFESEGGPTFDGPFTINETTSSSINGNLADGVSLLQLNSSNVSTAGGLASCLNCNTSGGALKFGQTLTNPAISTITSNNKMNLTTSGAFGIEISPNSTKVLEVVTGGTSVTGKTSATDQPYLEVKNSGSIVISTSTTTTLTGLIVDTSVGSGITYNSGTGVFTVNANGVYQISYTATWQGINLGSRLAYIEFNGKLYAYCGMSNVSSDAVSSTGGLPLRLLATNTFTVKVSQNSGSPVDLTAVYVNITQLS